MTADHKLLGAIFDAHTDAEFKTRDIEATMATILRHPTRQASPCSAMQPRRLL
jgi:hypothetical protein